MQRQKKRIPVFVLFFILSILIYFFSLSGWTDDIISSIQRVFIRVPNAGLLMYVDNDPEKVKLKNENSALRAKMVKLKNLEMDNKALRDQFAIVNPRPSTLIPCRVVTKPVPILSRNEIDEVIIDAGDRSGVKTKNQVVYKDNLLGSIIKTSPELSVVRLLNHEDSVFTGKTLNTNAVGIVKGTGERNMIFDNVALNEKLEIGDTVITNDTFSLVIGKIASVNKIPSDLFQSAEVESLVDITSLNTVFVKID